MICRAWCKMKMWDPQLIIIKAANSNSSALLSQAQALLRVWFHNTVQLTHQEAGPTTTYKRTIKMENEVKTLQM